VRNLKTILYLCFLHFAITSCSSLKGTVDSENRIHLSDSTPQHLAGKFKTSSTLPATSYKADLAWDIFDWGYTPKTSFDYIEIRPAANNKLLIEYWDSTTLIKSKLFKGNFKNGYFIFKRKYLVIPAVLVNLFRARSFRIGLLPNGNLITDYKQVSGGSFYVLLPYFNKKKEYAVEFEKLNSVPAGLSQHSPNLLQP
jgi:hypothetical protein